MQNSTLLDVSGDHLSSHSLFASLTLMHAPEIWVQRIDEHFRIAVDSVLRSVSLEIVLPDADYFANQQIKLAQPDDDILVPVSLVTPKRRKLLAIEDLMVDDTPSCRLSHQEHLVVSELMILARFYSVAGHVLANDPSQREFLETCIEELAGIPAASSTEANTVLSKCFNAKGSLKGLKRSTRTRELRQDERRLYALCEQLAASYPIFVPVIGPPGSRHRISYTIADTLEADMATGTTMLKRYLGSQPTAFRVHLPLAKLTGSYTATVEAPEDHLIYEQRLLTRSHTISTPRKAALASWRSDRELKGYTNHQENHRTWTSRTGGGTSRSSLFVAGGRRENDALYLGTRFFEKPPGSCITPLSFGLVGFIVLVMISGWSYLGGVEARSDVPAVAIALAALVPTVAGIVPAGKGVAGSPVLPRLLLLSQTVVLAIFTLWLLSRASAPNRPGDAWLDSQDAAFRFFYFFGGIVSIALMSLSGIVAWARVRHAFLTQYTSARRIGADPRDDKEGEMRRG